MENTNTNGLMPLNLQFFAEEGNGQEGTPAQAGMEAKPDADGALEASKAKPDADNKPAEQKPKDVDLNAMLAEDKKLQSQFDKLVGKALTTAQAKWEKEKEMTAEQLAEVKAQEKAKDLAEREQAVVARELRAQALGTLSEKGLPAVLVDAIACTDEEGMNAQLAKVEKAFRAAVDKAVKEKLAGNPPPAGNGQGTADPYQQKVDKYTKRRT